MLEEDTGSFRDPSGRVFKHGDRVLRTIMESYGPHWEHAENSGLLKLLRSSGAIIEYDEIPPLEGSWKSLHVQTIPWISYPYEWSFSQLLDAALLTLEIQKNALQHGMTLKDASAYNIQFIGSSPVFIDLLSFEKRDPSAPWQAYRQFCMHFLAPLALSHYEARLGRLPALWIDGIPLDIAWNMLPGKAALSAGLQMHLNLHSKAERKYSDGRKSAERVKKATVSTQGLIDLTDSLLRTVSSLSGQRTGGEWTDYYQDTNYSSQAEESKQKYVRRVSSMGHYGVALDLGANTGVYSAILAETVPYVISADIDAQAVNVHYRRLRREENRTTLPLVIDLANPSPAIGWSCSERASFMQRGQVDLVCALALVHHLYFTNGIPWDKQAAFFADLVKDDGVVMLEFVHPEDSQVKRLLAARDETLSDYSMESMKKALSTFFTVQEEYRLPESERTVLLFQKHQGIC